MTTAVKPFSRQEGEHLHFRLHPGQAKAWRSRRRFIWVISGTQGGKTSFGPLWLKREIDERGPGDYLAVTSTIPLLKLKMLPEFLRLFDTQLHLGTWRAVDKVFQFRDGVTRVIFGSATNPESLESATAKAVWMDECGQDDFRLESWEAIQRRLALNEGRALGTTTPYNLGWLAKQVYDKWRAGDTDHDVIQFRSVDNPAFPRAEYERARRTLPAWKFRMFYDGQFDKPAGLIYSDFDDRYREEGGHRVHPFAIPPEWPRYLGVDFGAVNTAVVWVAHDPQANVYYLYDATLEGGLTTSEHVRRTRAKLEGVNFSGAHGGAKGETQQRRDWSDAGLYIPDPDVIDVEAGIDRVIALVKTRRLYVFDTALGVLDEVGTYSRETDEMGEPTEKIKNKETFHRLDALRYVVGGLTMPAPGIRWI